MHSHFSQLQVDAVEESGSVTKNGRFSSGNIVPSFNAVSGKYTFVRFCMGTEVIAKVSGVVSQCVVCLSILHSPLYYVILLY